MPPFRPDPRELDLLVRTLSPLMRIASPSFHGLDRIPATRPLLFVGNHTLYGMLDVPFMFAELWRTHRICLRGLGDHLHFKVPLWRDLLTRFGAVEGTPETCAALMQAGESVLVFPGGSREVFKRRDERYRLIWKERLGFARLALRHGCTIVPFAAVGADDCYKILLDGSDVENSPVGRVAARLGIKFDLVPPIVLGALNSPLPRPERFYYYFGDPIVPDGDPADQAAVRALRDRTRTAVEAGLAALLAQREQDPHRSIVRRLVRAVRPRSPQG